MDLNQMETKYNHKETKEIKRQLIVFLMISKMDSFALKHDPFTPLLQILPIITYNRWNRLSFNGGQVSCELLSKLEKYWPHEGIVRVSSRSSLIYFDGFWATRYSILAFPTKSNEQKKMKKEQHKHWTMIKR